MSAAREPWQRALLAAIATLALLAADFSAAQRLSVSLGVGEVLALPEPPGRAHALTLNAGVVGWRVARTDVDAWLMAEFSAAQGSSEELGVASRFGAGTALRHTTTFGPLGNVVLEGGVSAAGHNEAGPNGGGATTAAPAVLTRTWLGARGTLAQVALRVAADAGNASPGQVEPGRPPPPDSGAREALRELDTLRAQERTPVGAWDAGLRLTATYRPERDLRLDLQAAGRLLEGDLHLAGRFALRRARLAPDLDGWLGLEASTYRAETELAFGVGVFHVPRRAPSSWLRVWLGSGAAGVRPGVEASGSRRWGPADIGVRASWRPWVAPSAWSAELNLAHSWSEANLSWSLGATGHGLGSPLWRLALRFERPL